MYAVPLVSVCASVDLTVETTTVLAGVVISFASVYGSDDPDAVPTVASVILDVPMLVVLAIEIAFALPAVRAVTAAAAIRIFFIDICMIPLEVL